MASVVAQGALMDSLFWMSALAGLTSAGLIVAGTHILTRIRTGQGQTYTQPSLSLVFAKDQLIDADDPIWPLLSDAQSPPTWQDVRTALLPFLPDLPNALTDVGTQTESPELHISASHNGTQTRVQISPLGIDTHDWFQAKRNAAIATRLLPAAQYAPDLIWGRDPDGAFVWGNDTFNRYAENYGGDRAFADHITEQLSRPEVMRSKRLKLTTPKLKHTQKCWLEVTTRETTDGALYFATFIDAVVDAEAAQRNFVQTLSKTFANLTTGLAIFDRDRRLVLFNPALVDLSGVSVDFLSGRPAMFEFFDKLREQQIMPEPKNYDDWRERMAKLVAAASDDRFRETWNLSTGQTFDVTGRPYPDGAIAFLFNDISAEVSLTRGFRSELDTMQSIIDSMEDAVAVFNQQGILTVCNAAYSTLWNVDPDACMSDSTILEATQTWKSAFHPSPVWAELRDFVTSTTERASWDTDLRAKDGREVVCRIDPICYGATLVRFCHHLRPNDTATDTDGLQIVSA